MARLAVLGTALLLAVALLPAPAARADGSVITFQGGGFGHGVGMSQYGAYGMAIDGYSFDEILTHYYSGTAVTPVAESLAADPIWVNLLKEQGRVVLTVVATGPEPAATATFTIDGRDLDAAPGQTVVVEHLGNGNCLLSGPGGSLAGPCRIEAEWDGWDESPTSALEIGGCYLPDWNAAGGTRWRPCRYARGSLHLVQDDDSNTVNVSVELGIEDYLLGISEMPSAWGSIGAMEALKAQAVAARSYALRRALDRGDPAGRPWCACQLYDSTVDQFYVGWGHGTDEWVEAVTATAGQIVTHPDYTQDGHLLPLETFYASSTFGWTESSADGFGAHLPFLVPVDDHWSVLPEVRNPYARWERDFTGSALAAALPGIDSITDARVTACSPTGAALEITFDGPYGSKSFATRDLRWRLGLRSMQVINVGAPPSATPPCSGPGLNPMPPGGPVTLAGLTVDDASGDSHGNGDGRAGCGETVEAWTTLENQGQALTGISTRLTSNDPFVTVRWNDTSAVPDLEAGATAANEDDWDLEIAPGTPNGHEAALTLRVTSLNGGPWTLAISLPVACGEAAPAELAAVGDADRDGTPDAAVAYVRDGGPARLMVKSSADGREISRATLAPAGFRPVAMVPLAHFGGTRADEVAVLLTWESLSRVVVADTGSGELLKVVRLPRTYRFTALAVVPSIGGSRAGDLVVLGTRADGVVRAFVKDAATGRPLARVGFGKQLIPIDLEAHAAGGTTGLVFLGEANTGRLLLITRDAGTGARTGLSRFPAGLEPIDLELLADGSPVLAAERDGVPRLFVRDPATGTLLATVRLDALASGYDLEAVADLDGNGAPGAALLGLDGGGRPAAAVVDAGTATLVSVPGFPSGYVTDRLAVLDGMLAALGRGRPDLQLTVRAAATGVEVSGFPVP